VEATFGKSSTQYLDILEMAETYMTNMELVPEAKDDSVPDRKAPSQHSFSNLAFRPKKPSD